MTARIVEDHAMLDAQNSARSSLHNACSQSIINDENVHPSMEHTEELDTMMGSAVCSNLFEERPLALNSLFRFQLGSDIFDGVFLMVRLLGASCFLCFALHVNICSFCHLKRISQDLCGV